MTSSNGTIFRVTGHLCGEFTGHRWIPAQRPVTRSFDVFFDLRLIKRLSKQSRGWWFETPSRPLWRHCLAWRLGGRFNLQMTSYRYRYRKAHYKDKTVWRPSHLSNGNPSTRKDCLYIETGSCLVTCITVGSGSVLSFGAARSHCQNQCWIFINWTSGTNVNKISITIQTFVVGECTWICRLQNCGYLVSALMC